MGIVAGLLLLIFVGWLVAAGVLYALLFGWATPTSIGGFLSDVFTTPRGWALILGGAVVGAIFGWFVLALSVASLPMLVDCDVSAAEAVSTSWRAAHANKREMIRWGIVVTALLVLGSIPLFVGLAFVLPWLGYSTWHLYTRLVDREAIPARRRRRRLVRPSRSTFSSKKRSMVFWTCAWRPSPAGRWVCADDRTSSRTADRPPAARRRAGSSSGTRHCRRTCRG